MTALRWTTDDYERMGWHDNHIHAFRIEECDETGNGGTLIFDIDYILEWVDCDGRCRFLIAPARLTFHDVWDLRLNVDFLSCTAGHCALSVDGITMQADERGSKLWQIKLNWPAGVIAFSASGFEQLAVREPVLCDQQRLPSAARRDIRI